MLLIDEGLYGVERRRKINKVKWGFAFELKLVAGGFGGLEEMIWLAW